MHQLFHMISHTKRAQPGLDANFRPGRRLPSLSSTQQRRDVCNKTLKRINLPNRQKYTFFIGTVTSRRAKQLRRRMNLSHAFHGNRVNSSMDVLP